MVTDDNRETNLVAMVAVKANSEKPPYDKQTYSYVKHRKGKACHESLLWYPQKENDSLSLHFPS
jgi:hypothetical protein